ncbi:hypothetical protein ElyMa_004693400 [Elysia marginata]|uniref:Uncharacterized protein n=1 Tax=Elysia marginata TaxID=1093978 RepID=A0AAV4I8R7_9GAST|nr:hypothetical protein ElyMa_004693400 [Elysia marginata]
METGVTKTRDGILDADGMTADPWGTCGLAAHLRNTTGNSEINYRLFFGAVLTLTLLETKRFRGPYSQWVSARWVELPYGDKLNNGHRKTELDENLANTLTRVWLCRIVTACVFLTQGPQPLTPPTPLCKLRIDGKNRKLGLMTGVKAVGQKRRNRPGSLGPSLFAFLPMLMACPSSQSTVAKPDQVSPSGDASLLFALSQTRGSCRTESDWTGPSNF